jgi:hypothetical protein
MANVITSEFDLNRAVAPRLPSATTQYDRQYQDQLNNILRLYFNQLDNILGSWIGISQLTTLTSVQRPSRVPSPDRPSKLGRS